MFPRLNDLIELHLELLSKLRQRQRESSIVSSIADILLEQFSNHHASKLKSAYGKLYNTTCTVSPYSKYIKVVPQHHLHSISPLLGVPTII